MQSLNVRIRPEESRQWPADSEADRTCSITWGHGRFSSLAQTCPGHDAHHTIAGKLSGRLPTHSNFVNIGCHVSFFSVQRQMALAMSFNKPEIQLHLANSAN